MYGGEIVLLRFEASSPDTMFWGVCTFPGPSQARIEISELIPLSPCMMICSISRDDRNF